MLRAAYEPCEKARAEVRRGRKPQTPAEPESLGGVLQASPFELVVPLGRSRQERNRAHQRLTAGTLGLRLRQQGRAAEVPPSLRRQDRTGENLHDLPVAADGLRHDRPLDHAGHRSNIGRGRNDGNNDKGEHKATLDVVHKSIAFQLSLYSLLSSSQSQRWLSPVRWVSSTIGLGSTCGRYSRRRRFCIRGSLWISSLLLDYRLIYRNSEVSRL